MRHPTCEGIPQVGKGGRLLLVAQCARCIVHPSEDPLQGVLRHPQAADLRILLFTMVIARLVGVDTAWVLSTFGLSISIERTLYRREYIGPP